MDGFFTMLKNCRKLVHLSKLMVLTEDAVISDRQCNVSSMWVKFLRRQQNLKALTIVSKTSSLFLTECFQDTPFKLISFIYKYSHDTDDIENDEPAENISNIESFLRKQDELCRVVLKLPSNVNFLKLLNLLKLKNELSILEINPSEDLQLIMYRLVTNTTVASLDLARPIPIELCHSIMDGFSNVSKLDVNVLSDLTKQISFDLYPRLISVSVTITGLYPLNWIESRNITSLKLTDTLYSANLNWEDVATKIPNIKNLSLPLQTRTCLTLILKKFKKLKNLDCTSARNRMNHRFIPVICQNSSHLQWIGVKFIGKEVQYAAVLKDHKDDLDKLNYTFVYDE